MTTRCAVCRQFFRANRSRVLCDRHYWRVRRLQSKTLDEIRVLLEEVEITKACVDAALHAPSVDEPAVAPAQRQPEEQ